MKLKKFENMSGIQKVKIIARMCGDYAAFHEASIYAEYDITNRVVIGDYPDGFYDWENDKPIEGKEEELHRYMLNLVLKKNDYCDYDEIDAFLIDGNYYMKIS
jgi:hypothetical protein